MQIYDFQNWAKEILYMPEFSIEINNTKMKRVNEGVFLGVVLDENLSWKPHISHMSRKISKSIGKFTNRVFYSLNPV